MPSARERMRSIREAARRDGNCPAGGARRLSGANPSDVTGFTPVTVQKWRRGMSDVTTDGMVPPTE
jgi:hypothetical protein